MLAYVLVIVLVLSPSPVPLPPNVNVAVAVKDPSSGYYVVVPENATVQAAYDTHVYVRVNESAWIILDGKREYVNDTGRYDLGDGFEPGYHTVTVMTNSSTIVVQVYVLTIAETIAERTKTSKGDPTSVKYIYAIIAALVSATIGLGFGERLREKFAKRVEEI